MYKRQTWTTTGVIGRWRDIEYKPNNRNVIYAAKQSSGGSNVYRTNDGGVNWSLINNGVSSTGKHRPLIAVTSDNPEVVYALYSASDYSFHGLYKSSDAGDTWALQSDSPNILAWETDGTGSGGQSWYDLSLGVATNNENLIKTAPCLISSNNETVWQHNETIVVRENGIDMCNNSCSISVEIRYLNQIIKGMKEIELQ